MINHNIPIDRALAFHDLDPAIETLDGTMEQFSNAGGSVKIWLVMGPKVIDFQRAQGETEFESPRDALDQQTIDKLQTLNSLEGYEISDYGYRLGRTWAIGSKEKNDGALLIVATLALLFGALILRRRWAQETSTAEKYLSMAAMQSLPPACLALAEHMACAVTFSLNQ